MTLIKYNNSNLRPSTYGSLFDRFFNDDFFGGLQEQAFSPKVDIAETDEAFEMQFHLPGIKKENIKIDLMDGRLTVSGERKLEEKHHGKNFKSVESHYGSFSRSFYLPDTIKEDLVEATYADGILSVNVPKDEKKEIKRTISIK